jgi:hypothetical protein
VPPAVKARLIARTTTANLKKFHFLMVATAISPYVDGCLVIDFGFVVLTVDAAFPDCTVLLSFPGWGWWPGRA